MAVIIDLGTPTRGGWCEQCQLPSMLTFPISTMGDQGVQHMGHVTICDEHEVVDEDA